MEIHTSIFWHRNFNYAVMSQSSIRSFLVKLDGEATIHELVKLARDERPDRSINTYLNNQLQSMKKEGLVENVDGKWRLTEKGWDAKIEHTIDKLNMAISEENLSNYHLDVVNLVGSLRLNRQLDLGPLSQDLKNTSYHPETYSSMIYRPNEEGSLSVLTPSSGRLVIVGATTKEELIWGMQDFLDKLEELEIQTGRTTDDILIQNIVVTFDIERELDLSVVSLALGLENTEYEPEQFPGLIYRGPESSTILVFSSGKCVITGTKSYLEVMRARDNIIDVLANVGVDLDVETILSSIES